MTLPSAFLNAGRFSGESILSEHGAFLAKLARALVHDPAAADDLTQETVIEGLGRTAGSERSWLATVLRRKAARRFRNESRRGVHEQIGVTVSWSSPVASPTPASGSGLLDRSPGKIRASSEPGVPQDMIYAELDSGAEANDRESGARGLATTDEHGGFVFDPPPTGAPLTIVVAQDGTYRETSWTGTEAEWAALDQPLSLLRVPHGSLEGRVVDLNGGPLPGVSVRLTERGREDPIQAVTDDGGRFQFHGDLTNPEIEAARSGWIMAGLEEPRRLETGGWTENEIVMAREGVLELQLGSSDVPERGASARVSIEEFHQQGPAARFNIRRGIAGEDDVVRLEGLPVGQTLVVWCGSMERPYTLRRGSKAIAVRFDDIGADPVGAEPIVIPESGLLRTCVAVGTLRTAFDLP